HPINREMARELLGRAGLLVREAENGRVALERLDAERFDVVLMDVQMPEMDGLEAVKRIRSRADLRAIPVVAMTAHAMRGDRERLRELYDRDDAPGTISLLHTIKGTAATVGATRLSEAAAELESAFRKHRPRPPLDGFQAAVAELSHGLLALETAAKKGPSISA